MAKGSICAVGYPTLSRNGLGQLTFPNVRPFSDPPTGMGSLGERLQKRFQCLHAVNRAHKARDGKWGDCGRSA